MSLAYLFSTIDEDTKLTVWRKGTPIIGYDPSVWRSDICGAPMKYEEHGNGDSKYGWEVDHIKPVSLGGGDDVANLQPLHWRNNRKKGDTYPWFCH
jgi:5-methylcytosine-specific restriction endonuclease McrA